ncbi:PREDICTED: developmental pluripotency-associated protein 3 [Condylura cristata]|uniref:developmental pluripotency-associated protein 3 n=1 Tax=Condylura cristata TaxID=143302 RepID=UPI0003347C33|nr:PREDICTED: developmental pluripotency-associated protein 3 [Condylura cristata]
MVQMALCCHLNIPFCPHTKILEELRIVTRLPMESPKKLNPALSPESSQMSTEDNSQEDSAACQPVPEGLIKNLRNLTLNPSIKLPTPLPDYPSEQQSQEQNPQGTTYKRRGVRTLLSVRRELRERMVKIRYQYLNRFSLGPQQRSTAHEELPINLPAVCFSDILLIISVNVSQLSSSPDFASSLTVNYAELLTRSKLQQPHHNKIPSS